MEDLKNHNAEDKSVKKFSLKSLNTTNSKYILLKAVLYLFVFQVLHFLYDIAPNIITALFSGVSEAVFQHLKIGFYAYLLFSLLEFLIFSKQIKKREQFWYARLIIAVFLPWFIFLFWYFIPALGGPFSTVAGEAIYAIIMTLLALFFAENFRVVLETVLFPKKLKIMILILVMLSVLYYTVFTFKDPWTDVFQIPPGW